MSDLSGLRPAFIAFDLDGTLVDSVPDIAAAVLAMCAELGYPAPSEDQVRAWVGNGAARLVERALTGHFDGRLEPALTARALVSFKDAYRRCLVRDSRVYPGVRETLVALQAAGIPLTLVTNKPAEFAAGLLAGLELDSFFVALVGGDSLAERKPHALPLQHVAGQLGVDVADGLMVGDSVTDIGAARAVGIPVVCVDYGYHQGADLAAQADVLCSSLIEMLPLLALAD